METQHLEEQVQIIDTKVSAVLNILRGSTEIDPDDTGMIGKQKDHEQRISRLEKISDRGFWFLVGLSVFAGYGLFDVLQKVFIK